LVFSFIKFIVSFARRNFLTGQRFEEKTIYGKEAGILYEFNYYYRLLSSVFKPLKSRVK
jgi:hypothetical protein